MSFPPIPPALLDVLDQMFPERCPEPSWTDREVWIRAGERRVVRLLKAKNQEHQENVFSGSVGPSGLFGA